MKLYQNTNKRQAYARLLFVFLTDCVHFSCFLAPTTCPFRKITFPTQRQKAPSVGKNILLRGKTGCVRFSCYYLLSVLIKDACTKSRNNGCGLVGRDKNSGWNWDATNQGWFFSSIISTKRPSGLVPEKTKPAFSIS